MPKKWMALAAVLLLSLFAVLPALAQDDVEDPPQLQTDASDPNAGEPSADGSGEGEGETMAKNGFYCRTPEAVHPVVQAIAVNYGATYEDVLAFFCGTSAPEGEQGEDTPHYGLGVIMLAYETSLRLQEGSEPGAEVPSATELLACKSELGGWGQVWKSLGFKGRSGKGTLVENWDCGSSTPEAGLQSDTSGSSDHPGNGNGNGNGNANGNGNGNGNGKGKANKPNKPAHAGPNK